MNRRDFLVRSAVVGAGSIRAAKGLDAAHSTSRQMSPESQQIAPGIWKLRFGTPELLTPVSTRTYPMATHGWSTLPAITAQPVEVTVTSNPRGYHVEIPLASGEAVYGLGLQMYSFLQRGKKKTLRVNADPRSDSGDTHAPVPFYVTNHGYGIYIDTARYATFYCGGQHRKEDGEVATQGKPPDGLAVVDALPAAYRELGMDKQSSVLVEIPSVPGIDVYVFGGPSMRQAVQRYNLFSGGGVLPPRWGLGIWYRPKADYTQDDVLKLAAEFREEEIPCDVLGLEPGWQTHTYPCSYVWSNLFPDPKAMIGQLAVRHYRLNLWEHAFTNHDSPICEALRPNSGNYEVWNGLVPDFLSPRARQIFADFHDQEHVSIGVSGYKLDECDNSDFTGGWSFPEASLFPSGVDGEQMHSLFGLRYAGTVQEAFEKRQLRTYGLLRCAHALASPYPYVLYSDLYDHRIFVRALVNSGFSGLLWTPEVRDASSPEELIRRLQSVVFSANALINAWYIRNPPWKQVQLELNNAGKLDPNWKKIEATCREVLQLRMRFVPYLQAAFARYFWEGIPPIRALVLDSPEDPETWSIDDQFLVGGDLLVAPVFAGQTKRKVYLPAGEWFDFWTGQRYPGKQSLAIDVPLERIPLYVKSGSILPLARVTAHTDDPTSWQLEARVYGNRSASTSLYEEDGGFKPQVRLVTLTWDAASGKGSVRRAESPIPPQYEVEKWHIISGRDMTMGL
jgi:alpha-D-xyloside xylohydrolase